MTTHGAKIGYARVSTLGQDLATQVEKLKAYGCMDKHIYQEKITGAAGKYRGELHRALDFARDGDVFVVTRLDRLARSTADLLQVHEALKSKGVELVVIDQQIDSTTPSGKFQMTMLAAVAELERHIIAERTAEGRAAAIARGVKMGRTERFTQKQKERLVREFDTDGVNRSALARKHKISRTTLYEIVAATKAARGVSPGQGALFDDEG